MQKWEYCAVDGIQGTGTVFVPYYPAVWYFTATGFHAEKIGKPEGDGVAKTIALLGSQGWELVGVSAKDTSAGTVNILYFKRPVP